MLYNTMGVMLSYTERLHAEQVAMARQKYNLEVKAQDKRGCTDGLASHVKGAYGEKAVSVVLGLPWPHKLGAYQARDVGPYQVRTGSGERYHLLLYESDDDDAIFILVTGQPPGFMTLQGWCYGREGKKQKYWDDKVGGRPAYFVPHSALSPMGELPKPEEVI